MLFCSLSRNQINILIMSIYELLLVSFIFLNCFYLNNCQTSDQKNITNNTGILFKSILLTTIQNNGEL